MTQPLLSALIVAHNEENMLPNCLKSLDFADEIVVVLDRCTDRSKEIAGQYGAKCLEGAWEVEGPRRNAGIEACSGKWILEVDADERATPELGPEVRNICETSSHDYHYIPIDNYVGDRLVKYGWGACIGTSGVLRLFKKGHKTWGHQHIHPSVKFTGTEGENLKSALIHHVDKNTSDMLRRFDRYTTNRAIDLLLTGKKESLANNIRRFFSRLIKCYFFRKGYKEGTMGLLIALLAGLYPLVSYIKSKNETLESLRQKSPATA